MSIPGLNLQQLLARGASGGNGTRSAVSPGGEAEGEERTKAPTPGVSLLPRSRKGLHSPQTEKAWIRKGKKARGAIEDTLQWPRSSTAGSSRRHRDGNGMLTRTRKRLRHMTRGRVLRVDAELHDGQRLQVFNVHQATSGDMQLQQHTWQILDQKHRRVSNTSAYSWGAI
jgi:hypothetical protein